MKRIGLICVAIVFVFLLSGIASATKWTWIDRDDYRGCDVFVDADSVARDRDMLSFWTLVKYDSPGRLGETEQLTKWEFKLTRPVQFRNVEIYIYNKALEPIKARNDYYDSAFATAPHKSNLEKNTEKLLSAARKHAKNGTVGKGMGPMPTP